MKTLNDVLVGKIIDWTLACDSGVSRSSGHGEIVAALDPPRILVRKSVLPGDPEPTYMHVLSIDEPGLRFFDTEDEYGTWLASMLNDPEPVVSLVGKLNRPKP
jgi:hypothetical protein